MIAIFTSRNTSYQNIDLKVNIIEDPKVNKTKTKQYFYNDKLYFCYNISVNNSKIFIDIYINDTKFQKDRFHYFIGEFLCRKSKIFNANTIEINCPSKNLLNLIVFEFLQKDFIFNRYLKAANNSSYKTKYSIDKNLNNLLLSINFLKRLVSEPSNIVYPETFAKLAKKEINNNNVKVNILNKNNIKKIGLNCLLAVNQGSNKEPRVVEFSSKNNKQKHYDILFVGKGVCFDTGGISIKPSLGMEDMKWDMAGAAVVASIIKYLSNKKNNFTFAGIVGLVENMPDGKAYKPGDVIKSYKGINVEVLNTDAEGRLVLADIISYGCEKYKPKIVIDFATLTGAIMVALGQQYAGLYSNDDQLAEALYKSGLYTNEKVWRMPLHEDFDKELNSPFVDLKNISNNRYGGSVTAAQFLQRFVPNKTKWAHLDIAGVTWKASGDRMNNKGATGFGLTLIADFIDKYF